MKWVFLEFSAPEGSYIRPSLCHPAFAKRRAEYVCNRYGVKVTKTEKWDRAWFDLGGMIRVNDPQIEVDLGGDREFGCWKHQASYVLDLLKNRDKIEKTPAGKFVRFAAFPNKLIFMSLADVKKIVKALESQVCLADEQEHLDQTTNVLVDANAQAHPDIPKEEIREMLVKHREKGKKIKRVPNNEVN